MTKEEAIKILDASKWRDSTKASKLNPGFSCASMWAIIKGAVEEQPDGRQLKDFLERRVMQVSLNQKRPRY